jgi:galactitol-specific phosphotransferase system IIC component
MVLSSFPLHFVLYQTLTGSGMVEPYPETPERTLLPLVAAMAFIWTGAKVAPSHNLSVAKVLFALFVVIQGGGILMVLSGADLGGSPLIYEGGVLAPAMSFLGAIAGLYIVRKQNQIANSCRSGCLQPDTNKSP